MRSSASRGADEMDFASAFGQGPRGSYRDLGGSAVDGAVIADNRHPHLDSADRQARIAGANRLANCGIQGQTGEIGLAGCVLVAPTLEDYRELTLRRSKQTVLGPPPRVSVVTVTMNARATLARTIESVQRQTFQDLEHVVVDGASHDGTQDLT